MSLATRIVTRQCTPKLGRAIASSAKTSFAQPVPTEQPAAPKAKPPLMKEFKIYRWVGIIISTRRDLEPHVELEHV